LQSLSKAKQNLQKEITFNPPELATNVKYITTPDDFSLGLVK